MISVLVFIIYSTAVNTCNVSKDTILRGVFHDVEGRTKILGAENERGARTFLSRETGEICRREHGSGENHLYRGFS